MKNIQPINSSLIKDAVIRALSEDLGLAGDITSLATIPEDKEARLFIKSREPGILAGSDLAIEAFAQLDPNLRIKSNKADGEHLSARDIVLEVEGNARSILASERVALNFLGRMSGIATLTHEYVKKIAGTGATILSTRKTTPTFRAFEKNAILCGGGRNHRFGLFDAVLIKDNHIAIAGGVLEALRAAKTKCGHLVKIEIEVDNLTQLEEVLSEGADAVLLDNMTPEILIKAITIIKAKNQHTKTEASGGVNLDNVREIAKTGVDFISVGSLTHSAKVLDFGLDFDQIN